MAQITLNSSGVASSNSLLLQTNGTTTQATLDTSGNLGLGVTPSAWGRGKAYEVGTKGTAVWGDASNGNASFSCNAYLSTTNLTTGWVYGINDNATLYTMGSGQHIWKTASSGTAGNAITFTQAMTLDASGNLGIGTSSPYASSKLDIQIATSSSNYALQTRTLSSGSGDGTTTAKVFRSVNADNNNWANAQYDAWAHIWTKAGTETARIDSSGNLLVGTTSGTSHSFYKSISGDYAFNIRNTNATSPYGVDIYYSGVAPNNTSSPFIYCEDQGGTQRAAIRSNGGLANYSGNNVNLSDRREKTNFAPAGDYLAKICAIPVQTFNYIDQNFEEDDGLTLGVVAQDVQAVAPELVMESNWANKDEEPKMRLSIYQTDLQYALMKCIQEQQALITSLTERISALEAK